MSRSLILLMPIVLFGLLMQTEASSQELNGENGEKVKDQPRSSFSIEAAGTATIGGNRPAEGSAKKSDEVSKDGSSLKAEGSDKKAGSSTKKEMTSMDPFKTKPKTLMEVLDSDGDGILSGAEVEFAANQLLRLDLNKNGRVDVDELPGASPAVAGPFDSKYSGPGKQIYKTISGFDKNGDGKITRGEIKTEYRGAFRTMDTNGDRNIDSSELKNYAMAQ